MILYKYKNIKLEIYNKYIIFYYMSHNPLIFSIFCIDYRFDAYIATFYENINQEFNYFACTGAGGALSLGYRKYCSEKCKPCDPNNIYNFYNKCNHCNPCNPSKLSCNPNDSTMELFKTNFVENLNVALTLRPINEVYLLNHQDCGAIKAFLPCSGYPNILGENNKKEIEINSNLLAYAKEYMLHKFPDKKIVMGLVDINGSVAIYDIPLKLWYVVYVGEFNLTEGLWYGLKADDVYKL